jgi:Spy/CpxP family protein refolding chaperone
LEALEVKQMRKGAFVLVVMAGLVAARGQERQPIKLGGPPTQPARPMPEAVRGQARGVPVDQKMRYICKQLELTREQWEHAQGLFAILESEANPGPDQLKDLMEQIVATNQELQKAREAGDKEREELLREELRNLAPGVAAEKHFIEALMPVLTPEQQAKLQALLEKLKDVTDLSLKPIEVVRIARGLGLSADQDRQIERLMQEFRKSIATASSAEAEKSLLEKLIADIGVLLTSEQKGQFDREIDKRRLEAPPGYTGAVPPEAKQP